MLRLATVLFLFQMLCLSAGQLDLALVQFPEVKTAEQLNAALASVDLAEMTNADRTITTVPYLRGGRVLFSQSLSSTAALNSSTRLGNSRAEVAGIFKNNFLTVEIRLSEGVDAGLRRFSSRTYAGSAPLQAGVARVVSIRTFTEKSNSVTKAKTEVKESVTCHVIFARLR